MDLLVKAGRLDELAMRGQTDRRTDDQLSGIQPDMLLTYGHRARAAFYKQASTPATGTIASMADQVSGCAIDRPEPQPRLTGFVVAISNPETRGTRSASRPRAQVR
jgi:hypothetical protein